MKKSAIISDCSTYRYELHREWDKKKGKVLFIMLNPSTADSNEDDLTTIRCMNFAKRWGYGGLMIGNIYPFRAKRPKDLRAWKIFGERYSVYKTNVAHVQDMMNQCDLTVCAWGCNHKGIPHMLEYTSGLHYLEICDDGVTPKHPLGNLSNDLVPLEYKLNTITNG